MIGKLWSYENYVRTLRGLLLFTGLWPGRKYDNFAYRFSPLGGALVCVSLSCFGLNFCREHSNNLRLVTKSMSIVVSYTAVIPKIACFYVYRKDLSDLHRTLDKYFDESVSNEDVRAAIFDSLGLYVNPFFVLTTLLFLVVFRYALTPIVTILVQLLDGEAQSLTFALPYPTKYPWAFEGGSLIYWLHYAVEMMASLYLFSVHAGVDSLFGFYSLRVHAIFQLMSHRMRTLSVTDEDHPIVVRDCVAKHRILVKCCHQLQTVFGPIVVWISLTSAIIMCALIFQAFKTREWTVRYAVFTGAYILLKLLQAFMYAFYGSVIYTESENFREAIYSCGWPGSGDKPLMISVLMMLCHKPLVLIGCKIIIISISMFTGIANTTMSYFFLLQTLDEDM